MKAPRKKYRSDEAWQRQNSEERRRDTSMRNAFELQDRQRLYDEYDYQRSFGKTHEQACRALNMKTAALERMVHRSNEKGEPTPRYHVGKEKP